MTISEKEFGALNQMIPSLYEAAISPELWGERLDWLTGVLRSTNVVLVRIENIRPEISNYSFHANTWITPEMVGDYLRLGLNDNDGSAYFHQLDLYEFSIGDEMRHRNGDMSPSRFYPWLKQTLNCDQAAGLCLSKDPSGYDILTTHYREDGRFVPHEAANMLRLVGPHLTKVLEMNRPVNLLRHRYGAFLDVLDRLRIGVGILTAGSELILGNDEFNRIVSTGDCLTLGAGASLSAHDDHDARALRDAVLKMSRREGLSKTSESLRLDSRINENSAYLLDLSPLHESRGAFGGQFSGVLVTVVDPFWYTDLNVGLMRQHYNLTATEADVFDAVLRGLSNNDIADHLGKGRETVKSQLASIFRKTGAPDRLGLVRLAVQLLIPLKDDMGDKKPSVDKAL
ncbi:MAG: helix-turn-helix transcriptional regulator [Thalassospira sp.]|uniref:helix-turn-helix transcriptional regulator n=1 Tax=Thalassospira sp. TaxID=1912094 RepID=UPI0032EF0C42